MRWEKVEQGKEVAVGAGGPGKRWGHTCNAIKGGRFLYVFGGYGQDNCQTNLIHVFDSVKQIWSQPIVKGTAPTPRDSHSCTIVGDNLFVFGGTDGMNPLKDLHILDTSSHTWISPTIRGEGPEAREGHSATLVGKRLFIYGGCGKSSDNNEVYYNDLYILNTETFVWKKAVTTGTPPSARDSHTCSSWKNKMIVIGGEDGHDYYLSDVHILDAETLMWKELKTSGQMLPPRAGHSVVAFGKILFVFGGFTEAQNLYDNLYMLDIDAGIWTRVTTNGEGPSARFSMAGDSLDPVRGGVLFFIGGCNKSLEALDDIYYFHTGLVKETERKLEKLSLRKQLKLKCQEQSSTLVPDRFGVGANTYHAMPISVYGHPGGSNFSPNLVEPMQGKKVFQARVTDNISGGFTIETVIDGKPLRGVVFSNKPVNFQMPPTINNPTRKRASADIETFTSTYDNSSMSKTQRTVQQADSVDSKQGEVVQERKDPKPTPTTEEAQPEAPAASPAVNILTSASTLDKVHATQGTSADMKDTDTGDAARKHDQMDNAPTQEDQTDDRGDAPQKEDQMDNAPRKDDQTKDAPMVDYGTGDKDDSSAKGDQTDDAPMKDQTDDTDGSPAKDDTPIKDGPGEDDAPMKDDTTNDAPMSEQKDDAPMKDDKTDDTPVKDDQAETDDATMKGDEMDDPPMKDDNPLKEDQTDDVPMGDQTDAAPTSDDQTVDVPKANQEVSQETTSPTVGDSGVFSSRQDDSWRIEDKLPNDPTK